MKFMWPIIFLFCIVHFVLATNGFRQKRAYTMVDYICHKQPYLSICNQRSTRASHPPQINNKINSDPYDNDPMPTPGPLPLGELNSAYDVARRREQEEPEEGKVKENNVISKNSSPPSDSDLLSFTEETTDKQTETTTISTTEETTQQPLNPRLRYQQYEKALQEYYKAYPNYYNNQKSQQTSYPQTPQNRQYYQPSQYHQNGYYSQPNQYPQNGYYSQPTQNQYYNQYYQPSQYYPQQTYYPQQQPNYYQPNGFNFGIGSQLQIPFAGPIGISSGFGFSGKK